MLSRIMWIGLTGIALIVGIAMQSGPLAVAWGDRDHHVSAAMEREIRANVERSVSDRVGKMEIVGQDGRDIDVSPELKRAMAAAIAELVKAEADRAVLRVRDAGAEEQSAAESRRLAARSEVDRIQGEIQRAARAAEIEQASVRDQVRTQVREDVRQVVREAVRN